MSNSGITQAVTQPKIRLTQPKNALTQFTGNWWLPLAGKVSKKTPGYCPFLGKSVGSLPLERVKAMGSD